MSKAARDPIFTRYLYLRSDVGIALLSSILNKKQEQAKFWAMELYHSGLYEDATTVLWRTYYEFYATLNPKFESHFFKKMQEASTTDENKRVFLIEMVRNLIIRPHNCDVFMLREIAANVVAEEEEGYDTPAEKKKAPTIQTLLQLNKYEDIARRVIDGDDKEVYSAVVDYFVQKGVIKQGKKYSLLEKLADVLRLNTKVIILTRIMQYYSSLVLKPGKNVYLEENPEDSVKYNTAEPKESESPERMLPKVALYSPNEDNYLFLFYGIPEKEEHANLVRAYRIDWLYHSYMTPIWQERINAYGGSAEDEEEEVTFEDDSKQEAFYAKYGYNPDEQPAEVQEKQLPALKERMTWVSFYEKHKNGGGLYVPEPEFLEALDESTCGESEVL
jgi:hypothetical protein